MVFEKVATPYGQTGWKTRHDRNTSGIPAGSMGQNTQRYYEICIHDKEFELLVLGREPTEAYLPIGTQYEVKFDPQLIGLGKVECPTCHKLIEEDK